MMRGRIVFLFLSNIFLVVTGHLHLDWDPKNPAFDQSFYEGFLNPELCEQHLDLVRSDTSLAIKFLESGLRIPKGISDGNLIDLGNYFQCIGINEDVETTNIEGKFCTINVPVNQELEIPELPSLPDWLPGISQWIDFDPTKLKVDEVTLETLRKYKKIGATINTDFIERNVSSRSLAGTGLENLEFTLAVCLPKSCTTQEWINGFLFNASAVGFKYTDNSCRMTGDKPWAPADYVAVVVFTVLGFLTLISTWYDVWQIYIVKSDPKQINPLRRTFSLYTNARRLTTFTKVPGALECVDGIRAISMMWVICGHTFSTLSTARINFIEATLWTLSIDSTWVTAAPISVDTFFMISGMLLVYTTAGKFTGRKLLKNIHFFYLNRLLRMFPLLAAAVLIQASFLYRLSDGPMYDVPAKQTDDCRLYWWTTLLYFQNFANTLDMCLGHTWYLAIDIQMHILSPLILFWVVSGRKRTAWLSMTAALLCFVISSTIYNFIYEFPGAVIHASRGPEHNEYMVYYYLNTLTRCSPFFVGMLFGYLLHLWRGKKMDLSMFTVILLWICAAIMIAIGVFSSHPMKNMDWDNQIIDSLINSFSRPVWAAGVGLIIVACVKGYGGPVDWFLSLQFWKMPSRLSYGMYLFHHQILMVTAASVVAPFYFSPLRGVYRFLSEMTIAIVVSFVMTLFVDSPFSTIFKLILGGGPKRPELREAKINKDATMNQPIESNGKGREYFQKL